MVKCQHTIKSYLAMTCKSTLLCNLPGTFSLDNYTCNCMSLGKTYSLQCCFFFLISIKLLQSWDSPRDQLNVFFLSFVDTLTLYLVRFPTTGQICIHTTMNAFHLFSLPLLMFTILSAVHILHYLFAIYTAGVHVRGNASNDASNPRPSLPPIRVCIFSLNWSHHMLHCHVL